MAGDMLEVNGGVLRVRDEAVAHSAVGVKAVARSKAGVEVAVQSEVGVKAMTCSEAGDDAVACSEARIEDGRRWWDGGV
jgi:hypothetical protein